MSRTVTAQQVETLNHALAGFKWLNENHQAQINSATVEIDGEEFEVKRDWDSYDDEGNLGNVLVVEFE